MANLFILPALLGDSILTTGGIHHYNDEPAVLVVSSKTASLFEDMPHLDRLLVIDKKPFKKHWLQIWAQTRGTHWNRIFDLRGSGLSFFLRAKKRYIWSHHEDRFHKILHISDFYESPTPLAPTIWLSEERTARSKFDRPTLGVAPIPGWPGKQWPLTRFIEVLNRFCQAYPQAQVAIFAAPSERHRVLPLLETLPKAQCVDTLGGHLLDSAALIQSCRLFLANDSGLMHMSSALKTPTIALFGPSNEKIYGPWSPHTPSPHRTLRGSPFKGNVRQLGTDPNNYMTDLKVDPVWEVIQERWDALE